MAKFLSVLAILIAGAFLSVSSASAQTPELKLCTGQKELNYYNVGFFLAEQLRSTVTIKPVITEGSMENMRRVANGECDGAIVQKDALVGARKIDPALSYDIKRVMELYDERVHFVCNTTKFDDRVTKLMNNNKIALAVGSTDSGPNLTWQSMLDIEPRYKSVPVQFIGGQEALQEVIDGTVPCMLVVAGLNSGFIKDVNDAAGQGAKLRIMNFDDADFTGSAKAQVEGTPIYSKAELPKSGNYGNLTGWSRPDTISTPATFIVSNKWYNANRTVYGNLLKNTRTLLPSIKKKVGEP